jgi:hypothetical protein
MKVLTVNMLPSSGQIEPLIYRDVQKWDWNENFVHILLEDDDAVICLNANHVLGIVWKDELEPEEPEMWDVDDEVE